MNPEKFKEMIQDHQSRKATLEPQSGEAPRRQQPQDQQEVQDVPGSGSGSNPFDVTTPGPSAASPSSSMASTGKRRKLDETFQKLF